MWYVIEGVAVFIVAYLVGAKNPLSSVKSKIISEAQSTLNKIK